MRILLYKKNHLVNSCGGAEKIMVLYANELAKRGHSVILATRDDNKGLPFFELEKNVVFKHFCFSFSKFRRLIGKILLKLGIINNFPYFNRELLVSNMIKNYCSEEKVDVAILAGCQELIDFTAANKQNFPIILMMHSHPNAYFNKQRNNLYRRYINNANAVQILLPSFINDIPDNYAGKVVCIGNPVPTARTKTDGEKVIVYIARITQDKQQHLLIEAFYKIARSHPDWNVHFYGSGDKKYLDYCKNLISQYNLDDQIIFKGVTSEPIEKLLGAEICAFPSKFEGFGLSLTEAMSVGLPVIGFSDCSGVNELIQNNISGYLVKNVDELAEKLEILINDKELRKNFGNEGRKIAQQYEITTIINQWEDLIASLVK